MFVNYDYNSHYKIKPETYFEVNTCSECVYMLGQHLLIKGLVVEIQVFDDQLCGPHRDHLVFVALISFVILIFPQLFSAGIQFKEQVQFMKKKITLLM